MDKGVGRRDEELGRMVRDKGVGTRYEERGVVCEEGRGVREVDEEREI